MKRLKTTKEVVNTEIAYRINKYCCEKMKRALTLLDGISYPYGSLVFNWDESKLMIDIYSNSGCGSSDYMNDTEYEVKFCPFCGAEIE